MKGISHYRDAQEARSPISPEFVRKVLEPTVDVQREQARESMKHMTRDDLEDIVLDLQRRLLDAEVRARVSTQRVRDLEAAARRHHADVFPR